jgi:hypothetical protein
LRYGKISVFCARRFVLNVDYKKGEKQYPITIELSTEEARALVGVLDIAPASSLGPECQDVAVTLITTLREIDTCAAQDLPPEK